MQRSSDPLAAGVAVAEKVRAPQPEYADAAVVQVDVLRVVEADAVGDARMCGAVPAVPVVAVRLHDEPSAGNEGIDGEQAVDHVLAAVRDRERVEDGVQRALGTGWRERPNLTLLRTAHVGDKPVVVTPDSGLLGGETGTRAQARGGEATERNVEVASALRARECPAVATLRVRSGAVAVERAIPLRWPDMAGVFLAAPRTGDGAHLVAELTLCHA